MIHTFLFVLEVADTHGCLDGSDLYWTCEIDSKDLADC